jgi:hypothetical protein
MSVYYINPSIQIVDNKFENIMNNIINEISNLFITNKFLIIYINFQQSTLNIMKILIYYLKQYKFYEYDITNIYVQIYNKNIDVIINIKVTISKTFFVYESNSWDKFYLGISNDIPLVYNELNPVQKNELNTSIINGNLYFNNNIDLIGVNFKKGIILKKERCVCVTNDCNISFNYIITIFW